VGLLGVDEVGDRFVVNGAAYCGVVFARRARPAPARPRQHGPEHVGCAADAARAPPGTCSQNVCRQPYVGQTRRRTRTTITPAHVDRNIAQRPLVRAVNPRRHGTTVRTSHRHQWCPCTNNDSVLGVLDPVNHQRRQPTEHQICQPISSTPLELSYMDGSPSLKVTTERAPEPN
jgi:hypothetical protein